MDIIDLLNFIDPLSVASVSKNPNGWDKSASSMQSAFDECVTWAGSPISGELAYSQVAAFEANIADTIQREGVVTQIAALEASVTERRWREAGPDDAGGSAAGRAWLKAVDDQIKALRAQL